jgi:carbamoyltransferase
MKWTLGVSIADHDASICLLNDHKIELFLQEERSCRMKNDASFPLKSLERVKEITNVIDDLVILNCYIDDVYLIEKSLSKIGVNVLNCSNWTKFHHLYHAASGFYHSGFDKAFCLVIDGWGSSTDIEINSDDGKIDASETTSIFIANYPGEFQLLYKYLLYDPSRNDILSKASDPESILKKEEFYEVNHHIDIGILYGTISSFLGFDRIEGGKTMGLSSYGEEDPEIPPFYINDNLDSNMNLFTNSRIINTIANPQLKNFKSDFKKRANLAYSAQKALEKKFEQRVQFIIDKFNQEYNSYFKSDKIKIVISGGCALNVVGNSYLKEKFPDVEFYIDPIPNDAGQSIGGAKLFYYTKNNCAIIDKTTSLYTGPKYTSDYIRKVVCSEIQK